MTNHLKVFNTRSEYEAFTGTSEFVLPNVSWCKEAKNIVYYNPYVKATGVTLDKNTLSISEGSTDTLVAMVLPADASDKSVIWSSSDSTVVSVDSNGVVSGVSIGNAIITVTTKAGGYTAQCATSVKNYKVITYTATAKLPETTATGDAQGLHVNSFSGTSGQRLTKVSHTFEDGVGTVTFNDNIVNIGYSAFQQCSGLTSIVIPDSVTSIGEAAFNTCTSLTSVTIPDSVTSIGNYAFISCSSLTSITSNAVTAPTIQSSTFQNVKTGGTLTVPSGSSGYDVWMGTGDYYLGKYGWTKVEQ